jgi:hypothetical protein
MEKFLVLVVVLLFIYNLLKPNKKKQGKTNSFQDLQKLPSNLEQQGKTTTTKSENKPKTQTAVPKKEEYVSLEKTNTEVKTYDEVNYDDISLAEYLETKKRSKGFEDLEESEYYTTTTDTNTSFEKENAKWLKQSLKDNAEHTDKHAKKAKFSSKDIKKAYIVNQIMERKYI